MGEQRETFNEVAGLYDAARPVSPEGALESLVAHLHLEPGGRILEVGCGTGQTTVELATQGFSIVAVEPGVALAKICEAKTSGLEVAFRHERFEDYGGESEPFDAAVSSQAAHWIDCEVFLEQTRRFLRPGGRLGLLWHLDRSQETEFWQATQSLYARYLPDADDKPPRTIPHHLHLYLEKLGRSTVFMTPEVERWPWSQTFNEANYLQLLRTHSTVRMLSKEDREVFVAGHGEIIRSLGGEIERLYETVVISSGLIGSPGE
jgi:SAM-dependent methyltransferase